MNTVARLALFGAGLLLLLGAGYGVGVAAGPVRGATGASEPAPTNDHAPMQVTAAGQQPRVADTVDGLAVSAKGYTLTTRDSILDAGERRPFAFTIDDPAGRALASYEVEHTKELHLIAVRRDGAGFQHVHPVRDANAGWSVPLDLRPGSWRVFADFVPGGADTTVRLGVDVQVAGSYEPLPVPAPAATSMNGDLSVTLDGAATAGTTTTLGFRVTRAGASVTPEPYLGARGHLVALRAGDLAYLHVHARRDALSFTTTFPTPGTYLLYLDLLVDGTVRTAPFVLQVIR